jgi:hypothetical protein
LQGRRTPEKHVPPKSPMGDTIGYVPAQSDTQNRYLENGDLSMDENILKQET